MQKSSNTLYNLYNYYYFIKIASFQLISMQVIGQPTRFMQCNDQCICLQSIHVLQENKPSNIRLQVNTMFYKRINQATQDCKSIQCPTKEINQATDLINHMYFQAHVEIILKTIKYSFWTRTGNQDN